MPLSQEASEDSFMKELDVHLNRNNGSYIGSLVGLEEKDFAALGGKKGEILLYNRVQEDPFAPIATTKKIPYFEKLNDVELIFGDSSSQKIHVTKMIDDLGDYDERILPFYLQIYTDMDSYDALSRMEDDQTSGKNDYILKMQVAEEKIEENKLKVEKILAETVSPEDSYSIVTGLDIKKANEDDMITLIKVFSALGLLVFMLNLINWWIHHSSLKKILAGPPIELIRTLD